ncbi:MAG: Ig-like domain-containing protein, partial [Flavobacteriaceae bacterium]|nr:Ig-like domain-containing protein [Flavobacteriaceae bacterium]
QNHTLMFDYYNSQGKTTPPSGTTTWESSKNLNASFSDTDIGKLTAARKGPVEITLTFTITDQTILDRVSSLVPLTDTYEIMVETGPVIRVVDNVPTTFAEGNTHTMTYNYWDVNNAKVEPTAGIRWKSGTKSVATIDKDTGVLTAVAPGESEITVTTQEKDKNDRIRHTIEITVN